MGARGGNETDQQQLLVSTEKRKTEQKERGRETGRHREEKQSIFLLWQHCDVMADCDVIACVILSLLPTYAPGFTF